MHSSLHTYIHYTENDSLFQMLIYDNHSVTVISVTDKPFIGKFRSSTVKFDNSLL